jgi:hypothetical protein
MGGWVGIARLYFFWWRNYCAGVDMELLLILKHTADHHAISIPSGFASSDFLYQEKGHPILESNHRKQQMWLKPKVVCNKSPFDLEIGNSYYSTPLSTAPQNVELTFSRLSSIHCLRPLQQIITPSYVSLSSNAKPFSKWRQVDGYFLNHFQSVLWRECIWKPKNMTSYLLLSSALGLYMTNHQY